MRKKRRRPGGGVLLTRARKTTALTQEEDNTDTILRQLRIVQNITGCSTSVLNLVLARLQPYLKGCDKVTMCRVRSRQRTCTKRQLHGCVGCHEYVFSPASKSKECPKCQHPRYDRSGNAHEVILYKDLTF